MPLMLAGLQAHFETVISGSSGPAGEARDIARRLTREPAEAWPEIFRSLTCATSGRGSSPGDALPSLLRPMTGWALGRAPKEVYTLLGDQSRRFWESWDYWMEIALRPVLAEAEPVAPEAPGPPPALPPHPGPAPRRIGGGGAFRTDRDELDGGARMDRGTTLDDHHAATWSTAMAAYDAALPAYRQWERRFQDYTSARAAHDAWTQRRAAALRWQRKS